MAYIENEVLSGHVFVKGFYTLVCEQCVCALQQPEGAEAGNWAPVL